MRRTGTYSIVLDSQPAADVMVTYVNASTDVVTVAATGGSPLTFTDKNWYLSQGVAVTGVGNTFYSATPRTSVISHTVTGSADYRGMAVESVTVTAEDNESAPAPVGGVTLSETTREVSEDAGEATYTVVLDKEPTATFLMTVTSGTPGAATVKTTGVPLATARLIFLTTNWSEPQTVTVIGVEDHIDTAANRESVITHTHRGGGVGYNNVTSASVTVQVTDNDRKGIFLKSAESGNAVISTFSIAEETATGTYKVGLESKPTGDVTVTVANTNSETVAAVTTIPDPLLFTASNWDTLQDVTVTPVNDSINQDAGYDLTTTVTHTASGSDYAGLPAVTLRVMVVDDENSRRMALSSKGLADERTSRLSFDPTQIKKGLALWLDNANEHGIPLNGKDSVLSFSKREWPTLSDILVAQEGRELGELFAVTNREGGPGLLSFVYPNPLFIEEAASRDFGELREVVIYDESLEESERAELERYLACRWQLPVARGKCL